MFEFRPTLFVEFYCEGFSVKVFLAPKIIFKRIWTKLGQHVEDIFVHQMSLFGKQGTDFDYDECYD